MDATLRRIVYIGPLSTQSLPDPRVLSIAQREEVIKNGLGDREPAVRRAAAFMLGEWLTAAGGDLLEVWFGCLCNAGYGLILNDCSSTSVPA